MTNTDLSRRDYGPAGCASGCASRSVGVFLLAVLALVAGRKAKAVRR